MTTPKLALPELSPAQASKELTHNQALAALDQLAMPRVVDKDLTAPPGSPVNGAMYIPAAGATGAWAGKAGYLAWWLSSVSAYTFLPPAAGMAVRVLDELDTAGLPKVYAYSGTAWVEQAGGSAGMANPMTTAGDLIVGGAAGVPARLPLGSAMQVPRVNASGTGIEYHTPASGSAFAPVIIESTTARTLALADAGAYLRHTNASASTITVPPQSSVAWADNTEVHVRRAAVGNLTLTPGSGVTLNAPSGGTLVMTNNMSVTLKRVAADTWDVIGQTVAA